MRFIAGVFFLGSVTFCAPAIAQTLHGLTVGEALIPALKTMPKTQNFGPVGDYYAIKWSLPDDSSLTATASPATGKIVYLEEDHDSTSPDALSLPPGLILGVTTLDDIRRRFGSNGIGFESNMETLQAGALIGVNAYELRHAPGVFVAFVTRVPLSGPADENAASHIHTGDGVLVSIIVAEKAYLKEIWGAQTLSDPHYRPIDVPGMVDGH